MNRFLVILINKFVNPIIVGIFRNTADETEVSVVIGINRAYSIVIKNLSSLSPDIIGYFPKGEFRISRWVHLVRSLQC